MPIIYEGWAKPDDPIYRLGLVVSAQNLRRSPHAIEKERKAKAKDKKPPAE